MLPGMAGRVCFEGKVGVFPMKIEVTVLVNRSSDRNFIIWQDNKYCTRDVSVLESLLAR